MTGSRIAMTTPTQIVELIVASSAASIDERSGYVSFTTALRDMTLRTRWAELGDSVSDFVTSISITRSDSDESFDPNTPIESEDDFRVTMNLSIVPGRLRLLFGASLARALDDLGKYDVIEVADLEAAEAFWTDRFRVGAWRDTELEQYEAAPPAPDPHTLVKDFTDGRRLVPWDIRAHLLRRAPAREGPTYRLWRSHAARKLLASIVDQVAGPDDNPAFFLRGPPTREIRLSSDAIAALFDRLTAAAVWVYREGRDAETRHVLLANEFARTWRSEAPSEFGNGALDSARSAYQAYVRSGSRETLKALSELRKAVIDEAQKVTQRAHEMAGALWKDVAVAAIPFALRALPNGGNPKLVGLAALGAAVFLVFSFCIQSHINQRFIERLEQSRLAWRRSLQVALSHDELEEISERPLRSGVSDYGKVRTAVGTLYLLMAMGLLAFALIQFQS